MDNITYDKKSYKLHIIKCDNFKSIKIRVVFRNKLKKDKITIRNLLRLNLLNSTKKYPTDRELMIASEELYNLYYSTHGTIGTNHTSLAIEVNFIDPRYLEEDNLEDSIDFLIDLIFNPNVTNNKFDSLNFNLVKDRLRNDLITEYENPTRYAANRMYEEMGYDEPFSFNPLGYVNELDKINEADLYNEYLDMINNDLIDIYVIGHVDEKRIDKLFSEKFIVKSRNSFELNNNYIHKFRKRAKKVLEYKDINQSKLFIGFKLDDVSLFEKQYVSTIYSYILGGGPDSKLFKTVREKNSMCYYISSSYTPAYNLLVINSGINKCDYEKALSLIKKEVKNMSEGKFDESDIKNGIITYINSIEASLDSNSSILKRYIAHDFLGYDLSDDRIKNIQTVTKDMIIDFSKKIHLDTIFLLHGGENDEK